MASSLTLVGLTRVSIGPAISVMLRGCAGLLGFGHHGGRGQHLHAGLAHGDHVRAGPIFSSNLMRWLDVVVEAEAAGVSAHIAGIVPIGYADVVLRQQRAHQAAQQRGEVAGQRRHDQHARLGDLDVLLEMQQACRRASTPRPPR